MERLSAVVLLFCSGVTAGVLFGAALSVVPVFLGLAPEQYVEVHKLAGRYFDRVMPLTVKGAILLEIVLALSTRDPIVRLLFAIGAVLHLGVALVSGLGNVPINRQVKALPAGPVPTDWVDPRRRWQAWHTLRTGLGLAALLINASAAVLLR